MRRGRDSLLILAGLLLIMLVAAGFAMGDTVNVPPGRPLGTYKLAAGRVFVLAPGIHNWGDVSANINAKNITIRASRAGKTTVKFRGDDWEAAIKDNGSGLRVSGINFDLGGKNLAISGWLPKGSVYESCTVITTGSYGLVKIIGGTDITIRNCGNSVPIKAGLIYFGGRGDEQLNRNIRIEGCWSVGSRYEHCLRVHNTIGLTVIKCKFLNPPDAVWNEKKGCGFNLRDGRNFIITDSQSSGQLIAGPLADADGGINDPPGAERERKLGLRLDGLTIKNFRHDGYVILEAGLINGVIDGLTGDFKGAGGVGISCEGSYGPRQPPTVELKNIDVTFEKWLLGGDHRRVVFGPGVKANGKQLTPATRAPTTH